MGTVEIEAGGFFTIVFIVVFMVVVCSGVFFRKRCLLSLSVLSLADEVLYCHAVHRFAASFLRERQ
jgi:hypothetical protein